MPFTGPTATFERLTLPAEAVEAGSPAYVRDQHQATNVALAADGGNDELTFDSQTGANNISGFIWWRQQGANAADHILMAQADTAANKQWQFFVGDGADAGKLIFQFWDASDNVRSSKSIDIDLSSQLWFGLGFSANISAGTVKLYSNGVEVTYESENSGTATSMRDVDDEPMTMGHDDVGADFAFGIMSRPRLWDNSVLTDQQHQDFYDDDFDAALSVVDLDEDALWNYKQFGSVLEDQIGSRDGNVLDTVTTQNGFYWHLGKSGDNGRVIWATASTDRLIDSNLGSFFFYHLFTIQEDLAGTFADLITPNTGNTTPHFSYLDNAGQKVWRGQGADDTPSTQLDLSARVPKVGETYAIGYIIDDTKDNLQFQVLSDDELDPIDVYGEIIDHLGGLGSVGSVLGGNIGGTFSLEQFARRTAGYGYGGGDTVVEGSRAMMNAALKDLIANFIIDPVLVADLEGVTGGGTGPDKNLLPTYSLNLPLVSGDTESNVFDISAYRGLGLIVPDTLTGVAELEIHVSNQRDGTFAKLPVFGILQGQSYSIGLIQPWAFAKIVLVGALTGSGNIQMVLS